MTLESGTRIRTLTDLLADDGTILPIASIGQVIGHSGDKLIVSFEDHDTGQTLTAECHPWDVRRVSA